MSVDQSPNPEDERLEAAAAWLVRLQSDDASERDWLDFEAWLGVPANKAALDAIEGALADIDDHADEIAAALETTATRDNVISLRSKSASTGRVRAAWGGAIALALASAAALFIVPRVLTPPVREIAYSAPPGETRSVTLQDNSIAELNRGAAIRVLWTDKERHVTLDQGEVAFSVKHDPAHPFLVAVGEDTVRDVGTEFNIQRRADGLMVTVRDGAINVKGPGIAPVDVSAGHALLVDHAKRQATLSQVNPDDAFAWQQGRLIYHDATLATIVADLNRYGVTRIRLADATVGQLRFSGVLMIQPSEKMVSQLEAFLPVRSDENKGEIVIRSR